MLLRLGTRHSFFGLKGVLFSFIWKSCFCAFEGFAFVSSLSICRLTLELQPLSDTVGGLLTLASDVEGGSLFYWFLRLMRSLTNDFISPCDIDEGS